MLRLSRESRRLTAMSDRQHRVWLTFKKTCKFLVLAKPRARLRKQLALKRAMQRVAEFPRQKNARKHSLPGKLVISLTSYPARYATLHMTIKSLLDQKVKPDRIVLWIAHEHAAQLPEEVLSLQDDIFTIGTWDDIRNFKKIIPTLITYPGAFTVIADDDTYYPEWWLQQLVEAYDPAKPTIVCHRAHRLTYTRDGDIAPYRRWRRAVRSRYSLRPRTDLLPTGNGGVLYPPGSLPPETTDLELIRRLSATSDDVWLFFMWRQAGWKVRRVRSRIHKFTEWPEAQSQSLRSFHLGGKKDEHLRDMAKYFGTP